MNYGLAQALVGSVELFILVLVRMTGLFVVSPIFGRRNLPAYFKIGFAFFSALIVVSTGTASLPETGGTILEYWFFVIREFVVGVSVGFVPYLMFSAIYIAGQLIDMKIGFSMVSVLDPVSNIQIPVTSNFYFIICMLVFVSVNAHHSIVNAICRSYTLIPVGVVNISGTLVESLLKIFSDVFILGFRIAAPIVFTVLLTDVALGIISKAMPQLNVFMVGMPLKILVGLIIIVVTMPAMFLLLSNLFGEISSKTFEIMNLLGGGGTGGGGGSP